MSKNLICLIIFAVMVLVVPLRADSLSGLADVTVEDGAIISLRYADAEYVVAEADLILGTTTRWYIPADTGIPTLWAEGDPAPAATVSGSSTPKVGDVGSNADNFFFSIEGDADNISSIDGIDYQETIFPLLTNTVFVLERGGNDAGTFQAIFEDGSLGEPVAFDKSANGGPYTNTGIANGNQNAYGVVFTTNLPAIGVRIAASGHDTLSISIPARPEPVDPGTDGMVAYYALENDANDSSGNVLNGTIVGDPNFVEGAVGMGLQLDGVDDYVDLGIDPLFDLTEQVTLSLWINTQDIGNAENNPWLGKGDTSYMIKGHREGNQIEFFIYDGTWVTAHADVGAEFNGEWHHAAGTFDGEQLVIYVDGEIAVTSDYVGGISPSTYNVAIGTNTQAPGRFSESIVDEAMIYNRALSEGEIRYLAGQRAPLVYDGDVLDDSWGHDNNSDEWDGTGPGEGNPGGAALLVEEDVTFLRIQDTGDPRDYGMSDPGSNRKLYLTQQIDYGLDGSRLEFQLRVATSAPLDDQHPDDGGGIAPWPEGGIGYHIRDGGKGMVGIAEDGVGQISFSLAKAGEIEGLETDALVMNGLLGAEMSEDVDTDDAAAVPNAIAIADATAWNNVTVDIAAGGAGTHVLTISVNGKEPVVVEVTAGSRMDGENNYIAVGSSGTGGITAFDVDYVTVKFSPEPVENLVLNPSFGEDEVILDDPDWYAWATWNPAEGAGSNATIVDTDAADGIRSLFIEPVGVENWHFIVLSLPIPTEVGVSYTASFMAKAAEPRPLGVQFKATDNSVQWGYADFDLTTEWAEYTLTAEALNAESKLEFLCAGSEVPFWIDAVSVSKE